MRALTALSAPKRLLRRLADTWWFMHRLGYPLGEAWGRAGELAR